MPIRSRSTLPDEVAWLRNREDFFWSNVSFNADCHEWEAALNEHGYGVFHYFDDTGAKHQIKAHRAAWILKNGVWLPSNCTALHSCDNPRCVNDAHILIGTQADNLADMTRKGRRRKHLNAEQVEAIRSSTETTHVLAKRFNTNRGTVWKIQNGVTYRAD